jgi:hypothetical protein
MDYVYQMSRNVYTLSRKTGAHQPKRIALVPPTEKVEKVDIRRTGDYEGRRHYLEALEYAYGDADDRRYEVVSRILFTAMCEGDPEIASKVLPCEISEVGHHKRDNTWERLSLTKKLELLPASDLGDRYRREVEQLKSYNGDLDQVYEKDLVGVYRSLPRREVGWNVSHKVCKIGESTQAALKHLAFNILLHQVLHEGLIPNHHMVRYLIDSGMDNVRIAALVLHTAKVQPSNLHQLTLHAANMGCVEILRYLISCGTMPSKEAIIEIGRQLIIRSNDTNPLSSNDKVTGTDTARDTRIIIATKLFHIDKEVAATFSDMRLMSKDELERRDRSRNQNKVEERDLIDLDDLDELDEI